MIGTIRQTGLSVSQEGTQHEQGVGLLAQFTLSVRGPVLDELFGLFETEIALKSVLNSPSEYDVQFAGHDWGGEY
jgi:hypothetical protein